MNLVLFLLNRDTLYYVTVNTVTSFLSGFVIFPVLGFMALENGLAIKDVAASGLYLLPLPAPLLLSGKT